MKGFRAAAALDLFIVLVGTVASMVQVSVGQAECGSQAAGAVCANALCYSQFGYCGTGSSYCGTGCQSQCGGSPSPPPPPSGSGGVGNTLTNSLFDIFFPNRNSFYTYAAFISAANSYPSFGTTGNSTQTAQEVAAFCAHVTQETTGLFYINETDESTYCDTNYTQYPCATGQEYYGRGPLQLTWNYNYGAASGSVGYNILADPDEVATNAVLSFETALWFWTTPASPKPSCHNVMVGNWTPSSEDIADGREPGFGETINIINGGLECGMSSAAPHHVLRELLLAVGCKSRFKPQLRLGDPIFLDCAFL